MNWGKKNSTYRTFFKSPDESRPQRENERFKKKKFEMKKENITTVTSFGKKGNCL